MNASIQSALRDMTIQDGSKLADLSAEQRVLIVFLRHFGCIFCMEAMRDIALERKEIESRGVMICLVHMAEPEVAEEFFVEYNLEGINHVSDPDCKYYEQFGLLKGNFNQLFGLKVWLRTAQLTLSELRKMKRKKIGDGFQMPGVYLVRNGQILEQYIHSKASDRPDYTMLTNCCLAS